MSATAAAAGRAVDVRPGAGTRLRLFCFPYAGGGAGAFRGWTAALPPVVEVCPVYLPGRERRFREAAHTRMEPLVEELRHALGPHLDLPFAFFGHSMGAAVAYELARAMEAAGTPPAHLFVSGRRAPQRPPDRERIHALPDDEFVARLRALEGTPDEVLRDPEMMELMLPVLRADFALSETYRYREGPPLACPVSALGGTGDAHVSRDDLLAWRDLTRGFFRLCTFDGGHFFLHSHQADVIQEVADGLLRVLAAR
ncbi:MAG TPA: alpha/beta fold hydrolase [Longimicrobium sp.]|nr:alpha/beta fold hydrolase [Longimicrobium sp.]